MSTKQVQPEQIKQRPSISLPYLQDRAILASIMNRDGISLSGAIRVALREYARMHGIRPETLVRESPAQAAPPHISPPQAAAAQGAQGQP